ncbi:Tol-Pal system protein TolB [Helicobacter pametensis]|uniref:Tol-Pal system protein TolB n=1 Tax=Helicobacter pametensis TaxID=95149 RepID=UPI0004BC6F28|nr:Tol-Pal system protein TolB [Helicobacter pametensis]
MARVIVYCLLLIGGVCFGADARLEIIKGSKQLPLVAVYLSGGDLDKKVSKLLAKDLEVSGNFRVSSSERKREQKPNFTFYQAKQIDLFVFVYQNRGQIGFDLFDTNLQKRVLSKELPLKSLKEYPFVAHKIANQINDYLGAPSIAWMERKVIFSKLIAPSKSSIVVADYTLSYQETLIDDGLNIFPKWADSTQESFFFTKYLDQPTILKYDIKAKKFQKILSSQGMAVVSDVSADFKRILISMAPITQADVYLYDLDTKHTKRLTNYPGIDVGANFVEQQKKILFISDRLGYPNVFLMDENGGNVEQAIFHGRNNSSATSSGSYIVYSSREEKNEFGSSVFNLYLVNTEGDIFQRLTLNGANQMPRFSKDGENVMFLKNTKSQSALGIVRLRYNKTHLFPLGGVKLQSFDW